MRNAQFLTGITDTLARHDSDFSGRISRATLDMEEAKSLDLHAALEDCCLAVQTATREARELDETIAQIEGRIGFTFDPRLPTYKGGKATEKIKEYIDKMKKVGDLGDPKVPPGKMPPVKILDVRVLRGRRI
ncbi:MAG: hypothetical protein LBD12_02865, partial [Clostridiales Family XIII bacterium]|nr:hypothetical protein [Clostridiales Family XIII bacterium]